METSEKILRTRNLLDITFTKIKNNIDHLIDGTKNIIIDVEEI